MLIVGFSCTILFPYAHHIKWKGGSSMYYKTISETAKDISMPEELVLRYIYEGKIKAVHDGEQFLVNSAQFDTYHEQLRRLKEELEIWRNTPIPEDIDVKDED